MSSGDESDFNTWDILGQAAECLHGVRGHLPCGAQAQRLGQLNRNVNARHHSNGKAARLSRPILGLPQDRWWVPDKATNPGHREKDLSKESKESPTDVVMIWIYALWLQNVRKRLRLNLGGAGPA